MLVLDCAKQWQLIAQADHAELSGRLAATWGAGPFAAAHPALILAAHRHDDGWRVWDEHPLLTAQGAPMSFLEGPVPALLPSYEACAAAVAHEDMHAGLLVSMHVSGLRRGRYGCAPDSASRSPFTQDPNEDPRIGAFVAAEERRQEQLRATLDLPADELRHQYSQLQLLDVLSLQLCLTDLDRPGQERELDLAPTAPGEPEIPLRLRTLGAGRVTCSPWPFLDSSLSLPVRRRLLPGGRFATLAALRQAWREASDVEQLTIELVPGE
ncbi:MAG TPA: DUF3891 family protein [Solirubrobacteraceae bacterium]|jgi:hypothetical protein